MAEQPVPFSSLVETELNRLKSERAAKGTAETEATEKDDTERDVKEKEAASNESPASETPTAEAGAVRNRRLAERCTKVVRFAMVVLP